MHTALRYQDTVLARVYEDAFRETSPEESIAQAIGSDSPFFAIAAMVEIARYYSPELAHSLQAEAYAVADWPLLTALHRVHRVFTDKRPTQP